MSYTLDRVSFFFKLALGHEINTNKNEKLLKRQMRQESDNKLHRISCVVHYFILNLNC